MGWEVGFVIFARSGEEGGTGYEVGSKIAGFGNNHKLKTTNHKLKNG